MRTRKLIAATMAAALTVTAISAYTVSGMPALMSAYATDAETTVTVDGLNSIPDKNGDIAETQDTYENMEKLGDVELEVGESTTVTIPGTDHYTCVVIFGQGDEYGYDMDGKFIELKEISREDGNTTYEIIPKKPCRGDVCFSPSENGWDPIACLSVHTPGSDSIDVDLGELGVTGETQSIGDTEAYENMEKLGDVELEVGESTTVTIPGTDHYTCVVIFGSGDEYEYDMDGKYIELKEISREDGNTTYEIIPKEPCRGDVCFSPSDTGWDPIACLSVHTPGSESIEVDLEELGHTGTTQGSEETPVAYKNLKQLPDVELEVGDSTTVTIPGSGHNMSVHILGQGDDFEYDMDGDYIEVKEISRKDGNTTYKITCKNSCRGEVAFSPADTVWDPVAWFRIHTPGEEFIEEEPEEPGDTEETPVAYKNLKQLPDVELEVGDSTTVTIPGSGHNMSVHILGQGDDFEYDMDGDYIEVKEISRKDGNTTYKITCKNSCRGEVAFSPADTVRDPVAWFRVHTPGEEFIDEKPEESGDTQETPDNAASISDDDIAIGESGTNFEDRTDLLSTSSEVQASEDGKELDSSTEAAAGTAEITSDENAATLPQTGNNSLKNLLLAVGAFMLNCFGFVAVMKSGVIRRRRDEQ